MWVYNKEKELVIVAEMVQVKNPATGEVVDEIKRNSEAEIKEMIESGYVAFQSWKKVNAHERSSLLTKRWALEKQNKEMNESGYVAFQSWKKVNAHERSSLLTK